MALKAVYQVSFNLAFPTFLYTNNASDGNESDASAYLSDAKGRQVTPSVASQEVEMGSAKINNARRWAELNSKIFPDLEQKEQLVTEALRRGFTVGERFIRPVKEPTPHYGSDSEGP